MIAFLSISEFIGRFHPLLVHLPIGVLLLAACFQLLTRGQLKQSLQPAISLALFWGMLSAVFSCISGFLLSRADGYNDSQVSLHQWLGISVALVSVIAWWARKKRDQFRALVMVLLVIMIMITGHLGGSITHGPDYLTSAFAAESPSVGAGLKPIADVQQAVVYKDIIEPVLAAKCYSCHGPNKQKGKLRLDSPDFILKGGKEGNDVVPGKVEESELIRRIISPVSEEGHMPPKEKTQLTRQETALIHWWVSVGADFRKKVNESAVNEKIKPVLAGLQAGKMQDEAVKTDIPEQEVAKADLAALQALQQRGVVVLPVAANSNYLTANFVAVDSVTKDDLAKLGKIKKQLTWLKLDDADIRDEELQAIAGFPAITRLYLRGNSVSDNSAAILKSLSTLQYLNLSETKVTMKGLEQLKDLKNLRQLYLYKTSISREELGHLKKLLPGSVIDTGGYVVPTLAGDTSLLKGPPAN